MEIADALLGAYLDSLTVRLASGETGNSSFWVNKNGVPCDYKCHDNPSNIVKILEE
ncbi:hypothetical protein ACFGYY_06295 [Pasteurella multocida]